MQKNLLEEIKNGFYCFLLCFVYSLLARLQVFSAIQAAKVTVARKSSLKIMPYKCSSCCLWWDTFPGSTWSFRTCRIPNLGGCYPFNFWMFVVSATLLGRVELLKWTWRLSSQVTFTQYLTFLFHSYFPWKAVGLPCLVWCYTRWLDTVLTE